MDEQTQVVRQWRLLRLLADGQGDRSVKGLAAAARVSEKTIRRDLGDLRAAGFPIVERAGEFGRKTFTLDRGELPAPGFTYDEALALSLSRGALAHLTGTWLGESLRCAFRKLKLVLSDRAREYVQKMTGRFVMTGAGARYADKAEQLDQLLVGIEDSRAVMLTYRSERSTEPVSYEIHPYGLLDHHGALYAIGHSPTHGETRTWKLDRAEGAVTTDRRFERPEDFDLERLLRGSIGVFRGTEEIEVRVRFAASAARYASERRMHESQTTREEPDGSLLVEWRLTSTVEIKSYILSFGAAAEVLAPPRLREEVANEIAVLAARYGVLIAANGRHESNHLPRHTNSLSGES